MRPKAVGSCVAGGDGRGGGAAVRPAEEGHGFIQAIRLPAAAPDTLTIYPQRLQAEAVYRFENPETGETREMTGAALQQQGVCFALPKRADAVWMYQKVNCTRRRLST